SRYTFLVVREAGLRRRRSRSANDFDQFLGNARLANLVHVQRELLNELRSVLRGRFHGHHARGVLGGRGFEQDAEYFAFEIARNKAAEDLLDRFFIDVVDQKLAAGGAIVRQRLIVRLVYQSLAGFTRFRGYDGGIDGQ